MLKVMLVCRSCGFSEDLEGSDRTLPETCPQCGSKDLEFVVYRVIEEVPTDNPEPSEAGQGSPLAMVEEAFLRQVGEGEWEIDLSKTIDEEVAVAELEPGEYEIVFKMRRAARPSFPR